MTSIEIIKNFNDEMLLAACAACKLTAHPSSMNAVRDADGNLRELTDGERSFTNALRNEYRRRFL